MNFSSLRPVRIVVSLIFFIAACIVFIDVWQILPVQFINFATYLQFIPSVLKFIAVPGFGILGFIIVLALTWLFGRVYCSSICPVGTLQDFVSHLALKRVSRKRGYKLTPPHNLLRYTLLIVTIIAYISGVMFVVNLLDPYSNFGRMFHNLFQPVLIFINNFAARTLHDNNIYWFDQIAFTGLKLGILAFPLIFLLTVVYMSFRHGRLYCNTICPVGTILGLLSKFAIFKILIDETNCNSCGKCERHCKSGCIDKVNKTVDMSRCVNCYNCFNVCPTVAFRYTPISLQKVQTVEQTTKPITEINKSRRNLVLNSFAFLIGLKVVVKPAKDSLYPEKKYYPCTPPGSVSIEKFSTSCTACHLCVSVCPTHVLQPTLFQYGLSHALQPVMDNRSGFCNYDCTICSEVCPTGAILPIDIKKKHFTQIGTAKLIKDNCVVYTENKDCGACSEHCPTKAVDMVPYKNNLFAPQITEKYCVGCGACENICPTKPYKAIYVTGNPVHKTAEENKSKKLDKKVDYKGDFPF